MAGSILARRAQLYNEIADVTQQMTAKANELCDLYTALAANFMEEVESRGEH